MSALIVGTIGPIILAPALVMGLRHLFAWFLAEGVKLFLDTRLHRQEIVEPGLVLAKSNVIVIVLLWIAVLTSRWFDLPMLITSAAAILGVIIALWITIEIVRRNVGTHGWTAAQIGLLTFAGGNLPFIMGAIIYMAIWL
jgi:hypothetical protein